MVLALAGYTVLVLLLGALLMLMWMTARSDW